jgi:hypothetical protein
MLEVKVFKVHQHIRFSNILTLVFYIVLVCKPILQAK